VDQVVGVSPGDVDADEKTNGAVAESACDEIEPNLLATPS
jgi:hypothetical protein